MLLGCAAVGVLVMNPGLTEKLASALYGNQDESVQTAEESAAAEEESISSENGDMAAGESEAGETQEESEEAYLINPNPQEPITWQSTWNGNSERTETSDTEKSEEERLAEAGITADEVLETMDAYYEDCLNQLKEAGAGEIQFINVIPESLWPAVERAYTDNSYRDHYVEEALKELGMEEFAIQLQAQRLGGGYYRLYHNISTWN